MKTKRILPVLLVVWVGLALFTTVRSLRAHALEPTPELTLNDDDDDELDDTDELDDEDDDRGLTAVWSAQNHAYAVGERGAIYHSSDSGRVWVRQETGIDEDLHAVWGATPGRVWAVGDAGRVLYQKADGVWEAQPTNTDEDLHAIWGTGADDLWAAGDAGVVLHSSNGGLTWKRVDSGTDEDLRAIAGAPGGVYIAGDSGAIKKLTAPRAAISTTGGVPAPQG